jgi:hypothetical protein
MFPNLSKELDQSSTRIPIHSIRSDFQIAESTASDNFTNYQPDVIDFLRRCDTESEAKQILEYLIKKGEISKEYAKKLTKQLENEGIRSFGSKKQEDYYLKNR